MIHDWPPLFVVYTFSVLIEKGHDVVFCNELPEDYEKYDKYFERHEQRIYPINQIKHICRETGFRNVDTFDGFTFKNASERSNRVHFVMRPS